MTRRPKYITQKTQGLNVEKEEVSRIKGGFGFKKGEHSQLMKNSVNATLGRTRRESEVRRSGV